MSGTNNNTPVKGRLLQFYQGLRQDLPPLRVGQPAFCTDENTFWIGTESGVNEQYVSMTELQDILAPLVQRIEDLENA